jgi:hypothetical protein
MVLLPDDVFRLRALLLIGPIPTIRCGPARRARLTMRPEFPVHPHVLDDKEAGSDDGEE